MKEKAFLKAMLAGVLIASATLGYLATDNSIIHFFLYTAVFGMLFYLGDGLFTNAVVRKDEHKWTALFGNITGAFVVGIIGRIALYDDLNYIAGEIAVNEILNIPAVALGAFLMGFAVYMCMTDKIYIRNRDSLSNIGLIRFLLFAVVGVLGALHCSYYISEIIYAFLFISFTSTVDLLLASSVAFCAICFNLCGALLGRLVELKLVDQ